MFLLLVCPQKSDAPTSQFDMRLHWLEAVFTQYIVNVIRLKYTQFKRNDLEK